MKHFRNIIVCASLACFVGISSVEARDWKSMFRRKKKTEEVAEQRDQGTVERLPDRKVEAALKLEKKFLNYDVLHIALHNAEKVLDLTDSDIDFDSPMHQQLYEQAQQNIRNMPGKTLATTISDRKAALKKMYSNVYVRIQQAIDELSKLPASPGMSYYIDRIGSFNKNYKNPEWVKDFLLNTLRVDRENMPTQMRMRRPRLPAAEERKRKTGVSERSKKRKSIETAQAVEEQLVDYRLLHEHVMADTSFEKLTAIDFESDQHREKVTRTRQDLQERFATEELDHQDIDQLTEGQKQVLSKLQEQVQERVISAANEIFEKEQAANRLIGNEVLRENPDEMEIKDIIDDPRKVKAFILTLKNRQGELPDLEQLQQKYDSQKSLAQQEISKLVKAERRTGKDARGRYSEISSQMRMNKSIQGLKNFRNELRRETRRMHGYKLIDHLEQAQKHSDELAKTDISVDQAERQREILENYSDERQIEIFIEGMEEQVRTTERRVSDLIDGKGRMWKFRHRKDHLSRQRDRKASFANGGRPRRNSM